MLRKTNSKLAAAFRPLSSGSTAETECPAVRGTAAVQHDFKINIEQIKIATCAAIESKTP
jgi:hypothetical protein